MMVVAGRSSGSGRARYEGVSSRGPQLLAAARHLVEGCVLGCVRGGGRAGAVAICVGMGTRGLLGFSLRGAKRCVGAFLQRGARGGVGGLCWEGGEQEVSLVICLRLV